MAMTAAGVSQAAIVTDDYNGGAGLGTGTGAGELIFSILDPVANQSLALDMNLTANTFRNSNASLINTFSVTDSLLQSFLSSHSADWSQMRWNLGGLSNSGLGPNAGVLTTNGDGTPATMVSNGNALTSAMGFIDSYAGFNNPNLSPNSAVSNSVSASGYAGGLWGSNFGGSFIFSNEQIGFGSSGQMMSFLALGTTDVDNLDGPTVLTNFNSGRWVVDPTLGRVSYVGEVSAVPVPAAMWLFGSGLLGLVGISRRRKQI
jgi:hypothetical protein